MLISSPRPFEPPAVIRSAGRFVHLDMLRGLAALAVVIGHIRGFLLVDYGELTARAAWHHGIYFAGGLGHQSVIAFFALSGFLVGGKALKDMIGGSWSWGRYMAARLARLWTVVVPALLLTLALDATGMAMGGGRGYDGSLFGLLSSGPSRNEPIDHSIATFLANLAFLQTISAPVYGSNGPLWSLANEFWYYVAFPLAASALLVPASLQIRALSLIAAALLGWLLPFELLLLGVIWVSGAIAQHLMSHARLRTVFAHPFYAILTIAGVGAAVAGGFRWKGTHYDLAMGLAWAAVLPALALLPDVRGIYARIASCLSEISYTLYATHFPILAFIYFTLIAPSQWPPGWDALAAGLAMLAAALIAATAMWWCFERNTQLARTAVAALLPAAGNSKAR